MPKKYKSVKDYPAEFQYLIEKVNLLPIDLKQFENDLMELSVQFNAEFYGLKEPLERNLSALLQKCGEKLRKLISPEFEKRFEYTIERHGFHNVLSQLFGLVNEKITLKTIIQSFEAFKDFNNPSQTFGFDESIAAFGFNEDSTIQLAGFRVIEILKRNEIPIERLRICPICQDIFWLKDKKHKTCGKQKCINGLQNQYKKIARKKAKAENAEKERMKKEMREKQKNQDFSKKGRKKKNGTL